MLSDPVVIGLDPSLTGFGASDGLRHVVWATQPLYSLRERCATIYTKLVAFSDSAASARLWWIIEGPVFAAYAQATNLYDRGYLQSTIDDAAEACFVERLIVVQPAVLKKFVTGKGNADKTKMALRVSARWKFEPESDRGGNLVDAYALYQYGLALAAGEIEHVENAKRGARKKAS